MKNLLKVISIFLATSLLFTGCDYFDDSGDQNITNAPSVSDENYDASQTDVDSNTAPIANDITGISVNLNTQRIITLQASDSDGDSLIYSITTNPTNGSLVLSGDTVTYDPNMNYVGNDTFSYRVYDGKEYSNIASVDLVISGTVDATAPVVTSSSPVNSGTNISINTAIDIVFSEAMDSSTMTTSSLRLQDSASNNISGSVTYNSATFTATFTPTNSLAYATDYTLSVLVSATDTSGNQLAAVELINFQTEASNEAPVPSSPNSYNVSEGNSTVGTVTAVDPESDALTFSLSGVDAATFSIGSVSGELTFATEPDFEAPGDLDSNNVYEITVVISDSVNSADHNISINVTNKLSKWGVMKWGEKWYDQ